MGCFSASAINFCESKAEQVPNFSASYTIQADARGTSLALPQPPGGHSTFLEDSWTLLSFPTDSPVMAVLPCTPLAAGARILLFVWWILLLRPFKLAFALRPPVCFPEGNYKQVNVSYQLIIYNSWKETA